MSPLTHHYERTVFVRASTDEVFAYMDDPTRVAAHMNKSSWMLGGSRMEIEIDQGRGQRVGSRIRLIGKIFNRELSLEEVVSERNPPHRKVWETIGTPRLLVIGHYRMGFDITPRQCTAVLCVHIDYALPEGTLLRSLGYLLGPLYARWCVQRMAADAVRHFDLLLERTDGAARSV